MFFGFFGLRKKRTGEDFLRSYVFPEELIRRLMTNFDYSKNDIEEIKAGFKDFVLLCMKSKKSVAMPSKAVDDLWHEFLTFEKEYRDFCEKALGRFLEHEPNERRSQSYVQKELRRTWVIACKKEGINPTAPFRIPRLFAVDGKLKVCSGFNYRKADTMADNIFDNDLIFPFFFLESEFFEDGFDLTDEEYALEVYPECNSGRYEDNHLAAATAAVAATSIGSGDGRGSSDSGSSSDSYSSGSSCGSGCGGEG